LEAVAHHRKAPLQAYSQPGSLVQLLALHSLEERPELPVAAQALALPEPPRQAVLRALHQWAVRPVQLLQLERFPLRELAGIQPGLMALPVEQELLAVEPPLPVLREQIAPELAALLEPPAAVPEQVVPQLLVLLAPGGLREPRPVEEQIVPAVRLAAQPVPEQARSRRRRP